MDDPSDAVIEAHDDMRDEFNVAEELLRLVGRDQHARLVKTLVNQPYERDRTLPVLNTAEITALLDAIHGLTTDFQTLNYLSSSFSQSSEQINLLKDKTSVIPYNETDEANLPHLLAQTLAGVATLEKILRRALDLNAHVAL